MKREHKRSRTIRFPTMVTLNLLCKKKAFSMAPKISNKRADELSMDLYILCTHKINNFHQCLSLISKQSFFCSCRHILEPEGEQRTSLIVANAIICSCSHHPAPGVAYDITHQQYHKFNDSVEWKSFAIVGKKRKEESIKSPWKVHGSKWKAKGSLYKWHSTSFMSPVAFCSIESEQIISI